MRTLATALAVLALTPAAAWASCAGVQPTAVPRVIVDPLAAAGPAEVLQAFTLTFNRTGMDDTPLAIEYQIVDEDSATRPRVGANQGPTVDFQSRDSRREIGVFRGSAFSSLQAGKLTVNARQPSATAQIYLRVTDLRADLAAGVYRESFTVRFRCGSDQMSADESYGVVSVQIVVPNVLSANLAGASTRGQIDFSDFAMLERSLNLSVRSTGPYRISARSLNGGEMRREGAAAPGPADRIAYETRLDGDVLPVTGSSLKMNRAGLVGRQFSLDVAVEPVGDKRAGLYADTLLVTLTPEN